MLHHYKIRLAVTARNYEDLDFENVLKFLDQRLIDLDVDDIYQASENVILFTMSSDFETSGVQDLVGSRVEGNFIVSNLYIKISILEIIQEEVLLENHINEISFFGFEDGISVYECSSPRSEFTPGTQTTPSTISVPSPQAL